MQRNIRIKTVPQSKPDLRKLARALLLLVEQQQAEASGKGSGDAEPSSGAAA